MSILSLIFYSYSESYWCTPPPFGCLPSSLSPLLLAPSTYICCLVNPSFWSSACLCSYSSYGVTLSPLLSRHPILPVSFARLPPECVVRLNWVANGPSVCGKSLEDPHAGHQIPPFFTRNSGRGNVHHQRRRACVHWMCTQDISFL